MNSATRDKGKDQGLCLLGAKAILKNIKALRREIKKEKGGADVEAVHQMRVASRRIRTDMPIFQICFKTKQHKRWRKAMKQVTQSLGAARDVDVEIEYLRSFLLHAPSEAIPGVGALFSSKQVKRKELEAPIVASLAKLRDKETLVEMRSVLKKKVRRFKGHESEVRTADSYAAALARVSEHTKELLELESYVADQEAKVKHHAMRIAAKRLRYTMEAFSPLFDDKLKEDIEVLKSLQDLLGDMHDCVVWTDSLPELLAPVASATHTDEVDVGLGLEAVAQDRETARLEMHRQFVATWNDLRTNKFFENIVEKFQMALSEVELGGPIADSLHRPARLGLISDVHGNLDALDAVLEEGKEEGVEAYLNLGDSVGFGGYSEEVVEKLRSSCILNIAGNYDLKVLRTSRSPKKNKSKASKEKVAAVAAKDLSKGNLNFLASLPSEVHADLGGRRAILVHASPLDDDEHLSDETPDSRLEEIAKATNADVILVGHSHKPLSRTVAGTMFINPGSVGRPLDGDPRASYAILDTKDFSVQPRRVRYDVHAAARAIIERGLPSRLADTICQGSSA